IAGTDDPVVPAAMASTLYAAAGAPKKLWIVPGAHHGDYASVAPVEYAERLARFFAVALQVSDG
ncbi:MAG TPA: alpha/beta hydrolase, partial [Polyangiaceae bacterium]